MDHTIIAIDPGREKCGIAVVHRTRGVLCQTVIPTAELSRHTTKLATTYNTTTIVLGNGTAHQYAKTALTSPAAAGNPFTITLVDEHHSTEEARKRYWHHNPPTGWRRLIPVTMQVPPVPVDDYVAVILAERYFSLGSSREPSP